MALYPGAPGWAGARRELLDFMVQRKINRGRHTDHPAGRHSIWTNQYPPPLHHPPIFLQAGCPSCRPTNSVKALKATSAFGLWRRCQSSPQRCYLHHLRYPVISTTRTPLCCEGAGMAKTNTYASLVADIVPNSNSTDVRMITTAICSLPFIIEICTQRYHFMTLFSK